MFVCDNVWGLVLQHQSLFDNSHNRWHPTERDCACLDTPRHPTRPSPALMRSLHGFRSETNTLNKLLAIYWRSIGDLLAIPIGDLVAILFLQGFVCFAGKKAE